MTTSTQQKQVPAWDLDALKALIRSQAYDDKIRRAEAIAAEMGHHKGQISGISITGLDTLLSLEQDLAHLLEELTTPVEMLRSADLEDEETLSFQATLDERLAAIAAETAFLDAELSLLGPTAIQSLAADPHLLQHGPQLRALAKDAPYNLSTETEAVLEKMSPLSAWLRAFDTKTGAMRFTWEGVSLDEHQIDRFMHDTNRGIRRSAHHAYRSAYHAQEAQFAAILDELVRLGIVDQEIRGRPTPEHAALIETGLTADELTSLEEAVLAAKPIEARWIKAQAKVLGVSLPTEPGDLSGDIPGTEEFALTFNDAFNIVITAWQRHCPTLALVIPRLLTEGRIDAVQRPSKEPGALCHSGATGSWVMMTWQGRYDCLMTLAHEIGHAIHGDLIQHLPHGSRQPGLMISESFAVLSEMLAADVLIERAKTPRAKLAALGGSLRARALYIFDQMNLHAAEKEMWQFRREQPLNAGLLTSIFGRHQRVEDENGYLIAGRGAGISWSYIWHLYHAPFYLLSYGAADCLAGILHAARGRPDFERLIENLMTESGRQELPALLAENGISLKTAWADAYRNFEARVAEFETLLEAADGSTAA